MKINIYNVINNYNTKSLKQIYIDLMYVNKVGFSMLSFRYIYYIFNLIINGTKTKFNSQSKKRKR